MENEIKKKLPVDSEKLAEFTKILQKYKAGKASIEKRTVAAENWWKLRNSAEERKVSDDLPLPLTPVTATSLPRGIFRLISLRLFTLARRISINSVMVALKNLANITKIFLLAK